MGYRRIIALVLISAMMCMLFSGCVADLGAVTLKSDGSGVCTLYYGAEEEWYAALVETLAESYGVTEEEIHEDSVQFTYNDVTYFGQARSFSFENAEELNQTLEYYAMEIGSDVGRMDLSASENGQITLTVTMREKVKSDQTASADVDAETEKMLEEAAQSAVFLYEFSFPAAVKQTAGESVEGITVNGNVLQIDYKTINEKLDGKSAVFTFVSDPAKVEKEKTETAFRDVTDCDWYFDQVNAMVERGLFNGKKPGLFCPKDTMTNAEFLTVAARIIEQKVELNVVSYDLSNWWDKYYRVALEEELISKEQFPREIMNQGMSRERMAQVAFALISKREWEEYPEVSEIAKQIPDFDAVSEEMKSSVAYCYYLGVLGGVDAAGSFASKATLTRAEASTVLYRILEDGARIENQWNQ